MAVLLLVCIVRYYEMSSIVSCLIKGLIIPATGLYSRELASCTGLWLPFG